MTDNINVKLVEKRDFSYDIVVGAGLTGEIIEYIRRSRLCTRIAVITDSKVKGLYGDRFIADLRLAGFDAALLSFPEGEASKTRRTKEELENQMLELKLGRDTLVLALGGGVVGDMAGFVAATYNRGVPLIQIPTTLLAMIDSSVGGKTGVDTVQGKNLIGAFYHPKKVYIDLDFLATLEKTDYSNGLAEIVKIAAALDRDLFFFIEKYAAEIMVRNQDLLTHVIRKCCELKGRVVASDERDSGARQVLNFGHTVGHALEAATGYGIKHGAAVSIGICVESSISSDLGLLEAHEGKRIVQLLASLGLPVRLPKGTNISELMRLMKLDKKSVEGRPRFVLLEEIGKSKNTDNKYSFDVEEEKIRVALRSCK